jgi:hypothetical protein
LQSFAPSVAAVWLKRVGLALAVAWVLGVVLLFLFYEQLAAGRSHGEMTALVRTTSAVMLPLAAVLFVLGYVQQKRRELIDLLAIRRKQLEQLKRLARRMADQETPLRDGDADGS